MSQAPSIQLTETTKDFAIHSVVSLIVDVPTIRKHKLSQTSVTAQNYVIVRIRLVNGVEGIGEAATLGGPRWSEESVEGIKTVIDTYLASAIIGLDARQIQIAAASMDRAAKRNNAAKAAIETALWDAMGKSLNLPVHTFFGGAVRTKIPVLWTLASGDPCQEIEEANAKLEQRLHNRFKVKIGAQTPEQDIARLTKLTNALNGRAELIVDVNQAWDESISIHYLPRLADMGIKLVEQPVPAWNIPALARLRTRPGIPPILADECVFDAHDMLHVANAGAADAVSLKLVKHAGLVGLRAVASVAEAAGLELYGGCLLESSVGASAHLQVFSTFRKLHWGCEHFGPQILISDIVAEPLRFADFCVHLPSGPGIGMVLDEDKLHRFTRA
ncbi:muconate/chloromuconate family cycloisomerase [Acidocella aminolytica]|nr:muconate/chloromuconate family cycloisomerase [Acidocella aminolytica]SHF42035.1 muconate cycloisomerase [Acidocella aminolytica 101 = DSM 11237]